MAADNGGVPSGAVPAGSANWPVRRRKLFYVAGFDPASPKKYHRLYREQAPLQGALTGARYEIGDLAELGPLVSGWTVRAEHADGAKVEVDYRFLHWFDLVRQVWPKDGLGLYLGACRALRDYYRHGVMSHARREAMAVYVASIGPFVIGSAFLLLYAIATLALCASGAVLAERLGAPWIIGALPPLALWLLAPWAWKRVDKALPVGWLARGMIAVTRSARGDIPEFAARADAFAELIAAAAKEPGWDEILVVAHSMGGQQAARALGRALLKDPEFARSGTPVNLLTLGSLLPFYSMTTDDGPYREEMAALVAAPQIGWLDITGPSDSGCAAALHPLLGLGLGEPEGRPVRRSPRFHVLLSPEAYRRLRREPLAFHFHYLSAAEIPGDYDFFRLTAGPERLTAAPELSVA
jgi:hypothetical protein